MSIRPLIKRCIKKGAIERSEPHFMCHALIGVYYFLVVNGA